jgi:sugar lactone lactonase YvrE/thiol-disulfide isomerase/thioredoxin
MRGPVVRAPELDRPGLDWLNVAAPLRLSDLGGRLAILDFWTSCCINCIQILPTLRRIEEAFPEEVVVIGVHSPKFAAEKRAENVRAAIARLGIRHPVVHDPDFQLWRQYAVRAWPTLVFLGPDGRVVGQAAGEPDPERLFDAVAGAVEELRRSGRARPARVALRAEPATGGALAFPGKIRPLPGTPGHWIVADAGHHQVVELDAAGQPVRRHGSGEPGNADGEAPAFDQPQGLIADGAAIFVADTGNHAIRRIDRLSGRVATLAGTGRRGRALGAAAPGLATALASPWDLDLLGHRLFFANAGTHQLGVLELESGSVAALAGTGAEALVDGPASEAVLAQPSGLALAPDGRRLAFADSETSAIRLLDLATMRVETLVGSGLFDFGQVDGAFAAARLQHPLGLCWQGPGALLVADSYNGVLRRLDLAAQRIATYAEDFLCEDPLCLPRLGEPAGLWLGGAGDLLVSDTNNHRILSYDLAARRYRTWAR